MGQKCDTMLAIHCVGVGECQSEDLFIYFGAKPSKKACSRDLPRDHKWTKGGKVPGVNREGGRTEKEAEQGIL